MEVGQARLSYDQNGQRASANSWRKPVLNHFRQSFFSLVTVSFPESTEASPRFSCRKAVKENWSEARRRASLPKKMSTNPGHGLQNLKEYSCK
jgi:hypothetical protein